MADDLRSSSARPVYVDRLALSDVPFTSTVTEERFYQGPAIVQRLNLILHLLRATQRVSLLVAADGVGKTTLLDELARRAGSDMRFCRLDGTAALDPAQLVTSCAQAFSSAPTSTEVSERTLQNQLNTLKKHQITAVLVIDNMHLLQKATLTKLAEMLAWQEGEQYLLQAVLSTTSSKTRLSDETSRIHTLHIPTLAADEVQPYLMTRLQGVGYQGAVHPFKKSDIRRFYRRSKGVPARINQLAHQRLLGVARLTPEWLRFHRLGRYFKWLGYALLVVLLVLALFYQDQINAVFNPPSMDTAEVTVPETDDELATVNVEDDQVTSKREADRQELETLVSELETDLQSATEKPPIMLDPSWLGAMQATVEGQNERMEIPPSLTLDGALTLFAQKEQESTSAPVETVSDPLSALTARPDIQAADWILSRPANDYTFQLMGSWEVNDIAEFIDDNELAGDVAVFSSLRDGKNWHAVIYGQYPSRVAAVEARDSWAPPRNNLSNWLRRFESVQSQIKERPPLR